MTRRKELQNDIASIRLGQLLVCALIRFPVQVLLFRSPWTNCFKNHPGHFHKFFDLVIIQFFNVRQFCNRFLIMIVKI